MQGYGVNKVYLLIMIYSDPENCFAVIPSDLVSEGLV